MAAVCVPGGAAYNLHEDRRVIQRNGKAMRNLVNCFLFALVTAIVCAGVGGAAYLMAERYEVEAEPRAAVTAQPLDAEPGTLPAAQETAAPEGTADTSAEATAGATVQPTATRTPRPTMQPSPTPDATATPRPTSTPAFTVWVIRAATNVRVRSCPGQECASIGTVRPGTEVEVLETIDGWHAIRWEDGETGYILASLSVEATTTP